MNMTGSQDPHNFSLYTFFPLTVKILCSCSWSSLKHRGLLFKIGTLCGAFTQNLTLIFNKISLVSLFEEGAGGGEVVVGTEDLKTTPCDS